MEDHIAYIDFYFRGRFYQFEEISVKMVVPQAWDPLDKIDLNFSKLKVDGQFYTDLPDHDVLGQLANCCLERMERDNESDHGGNYQLF